MPQMSYVPPRVWTWDQNKPGNLPGINRPVAGPTHESVLPLGGHPFQLYSYGDSPNGQKVTILLEELLAAGCEGAEYDAWLISIPDKQQLGSGFIALNPNNKIPALLDCSGPEPMRIFESGAILWHLAESFGRFMPQERQTRAECKSWLIWQVASGPVIGGGFGHFYSLAPDKVEYAIDRYAMDTKRIFDVADRRLGEVPYLAGDEYSIADIALFPWFRHLVEENGYGGAEFLGLAEYRHVARWLGDIAARSAVRRGMMVNRTGDAGIRERHSPADIDALLRD